MKSLLIDYHIHTSFSQDCKSDLISICEKAVELGLSEIGLADHIEFGPYHTGHPDYNEYAKEVDSCRKKYSGVLKIKIGAEIGEPHLFKKEVKALLSTFDFDFVLGSAHYARGLEPAWEENYFKKPNPYLSYFEQVLNVARDGEFDVLAHIDLVKRDARKFGFEYDGPLPYADLIREILSTIIKRKKILEINSSPIRNGDVDPCPSPEILKWYVELGGEAVSVGSDAHRIENVGQDIDKCIELATSVGIKYLARFDKRKVSFTKSH